MSAPRKSVDVNTNAFEDDDTTFHDKAYSNTIPNDKDASEPRPPAANVQPSFALLFSMLSRRDFNMLLLPAVFTSVLNGGIAPFMTHAIGQIFDSFSTFANSTGTITDATAASAAKRELVKAVGLTAIELVCLAVGAFALSTINSALWIGTGERNVMRLRRTIFDAVSSRRMEWFDSADPEHSAVESGRQVGAGGLMAQFARETDDVRMASSLAAGMVTQNLTTCIACLILAFARSWPLTLVILSSVPLLIFVQALSQRFVAPLLARFRQQSSRSAALVDRALSGIATVKAFNAEQSEMRAFKTIGGDEVSISWNLNSVWAVSSGVTQFMAMGMFVQGFWFGASLVRSGQASTGAVMATFWACLQATGALQGCIPRLIVLEKGKLAMAALVNLISPPDFDEKFDGSPFQTIDIGAPTPKSMLRRGSSRRSSKKLALSNNRTNHLRGIRPSSFQGEVSIQDLSFSYPSRPDNPVLRNISLYIPAGETTFIVGGSGSGKSTIAALISRLYHPGYGNGTIFFDSHDASWIDDAWVREQVAVVSQTCILFEGSVHDNVAMGVAGGPACTTSPTLWTSGRDAPRRSPPEVSRTEIEDVCTAALIHDFVRNLPDGYDTQLGTGGASLSGGQKQRLAIARALLRDPCVLVLDEATSALDATSRVLVFEAIKARRRNKTTIVITHDLSQIDSTDFVYVLHNGQLAEQGYRADLEVGSSNEAGARCGQFAALVRAQGGIGGFPVSDPDARERVGGSVEPPTPLPDQILEHIEQERHNSDLGLDIDLEDGNCVDGRLTNKLSKRISRSISRTFQRGTLLGPSVARGGLGWMVDGANNLALNGSTGRLEPQTSTSSLSRYSLKAPGQPFGMDVKKRRASGMPMLSSKRSTLSEIKSNRKRSSLGVLPLVRPPPLVLNNAGTFRDGLRTNSHKLSKFKSLQFAPMSPLPKTPASASTSKSIVKNLYMDTKKDVDDDLSGDEEASFEEEDEFDAEKIVLEQSGFAASRSRSRPYDRRRGLDLEVVSNIGGLSAEFGPDNKQGTANSNHTSLWRILYQTVPSKLTVVIGLAFALASGAMTPVFSFLLSRLLFAVSIGARDVQTINILGAAVLLAAVCDGMLLGLKFFVMECAANSWIHVIRVRAYGAVLAQPKSWHDLPQNAPVNAMQRIIKDGEDAKDLVGVVIGQFCVVFSMLSVGLIWALVRGWQLTLVGLALAPIFAVTISVQSRLVAKCEARNKKAREEVAKVYYDCISNIRAIRFMSLESIFSDKFEIALQSAYDIGMKGAFLEGCTFGIAASLIYLAEAVLFFLGAIFVANGTLSYLQFVETVNLVVFTVTIGGQLMSFTQRIAKSTQATRDINQLSNLPIASHESQGTLRPKVHGDLNLSGVTFSYPTRANVPVLRSVSTVIGAGEAVAIVGASGSGKSTVAALLQRLYEPVNGSITLDGFGLSDIDVKHLRQNISVVSQHAYLFDASVRENIAYGMGGRFTQSNIEAAARAAQIHDFIMTLPRGYDTPLGENGSLISGGQAQRLQIARALVRGAKVLILDECTSALDPANQAAVIETIRSAEEGRTTIIVTHKLAVMRMCERILVVQDGQIVEDGTFDDLMTRNAVFANLARAGEWSGE